MADGVIRIDTRLDNSKIPNDIQDLKDMMNNANLSEEAKQSAEEIINQFAKLEVQQARNVQRTQDLKDKLEELSWIAETFRQQGETRLYDETNREVSQVQLKLQESEQNMRNIEVSMGKTGEKARTFKDSMNSIKGSSKIADINFSKVGKTLLRTGLALFSIRSIFTGLGRAMQSWMRSSEQGLQAQADLAYVWQSIGNALAPVFMGIINLMKTMLGYVNAITQAFFGFSIFTNSSAKSLNNMNKSAKSLKRQLSGFDEMNVLSDSSASGGSGASGGVSASTFETPDISAFTTWMERLAPIIESVRNGISILWVNNLQPMFASIGNFMVGVGRNFITGLEEIFKWATNNGPVVQGLAILIGVLTVAFIGIKVVLLAISLLAGLSPFGWIVLAIGLIITAIGFWKNNQEAIQAFIQNSLKVIGDAFVFVFNWILNIIRNVIDFIIGIFRNGFNIIMAIMRMPAEVVMWLVGVIQRAFGDAFNGVLVTVRAIFNNIIGIFRGIVTFISGVFTGDWRKAWQGIVNIFDNIFKGISNIFKLPFNFIIDGINSFTRSINRIKIPSWVPLVGGNSFTFPIMPRLARGGIVTSATQAIIGEAGREAVIPLQNNTGWVNEFLDVLQSRGGFGGGGNITIIQQLDSKEIARHTIDLEKESNFRTNGGLNYGY